MCFTIKTFCCLLTLEVGAQIISVVSTVLSASITVLYASAAALLTLSQTKQAFYAGMALAGGLQCVFGVLLSYGAFQVIINPLLGISFSIAPILTVTRHPGCMWPWLLTAWATAGALLAVSVVGTTTLIIGGQLSNDVNVVIFAYVLYSLFILYCACVVNSRRLELLKEHEYIETAETLMRHSWRYS